MTAEEAARWQENPEAERLKKALAGFERMESQLRLGIAHLKVVLAQLEA